MSLIRLFFGIGLLVTSFGVMLAMASGHRAEEAILVSLFPTTICMLFLYLHHKMNNEQAMNFMISGLNAIIWSLARFSFLFCSVLLIWAGFSIGPGSTTVGIIGLVIYRMMAGKSRLSMVEFGRELNKMWNNLPFAKKMEGKLKQLEEKQDFPHIDERLNGLENRLSSVIDILGISLPEEEIKEPEKLPEQPQPVLDEEPGDKPEETVPVKHPAQEPVIEQPEQPDQPQETEPVVEEPQKAKPVLELPKPKPAGTWEAFIGEKLLSYFGITILVLGLAFLLAYSLTRMGPGGRAAVGFLLGATLLSSGFFLEKKEKYSTFGRILMAGGWATLYFTSFGAHHIKAMKVIDNEVIGALLLAIVAGAIISHSLKYASQTMTGMALLLAYITLFITDVTWYTHIAAFVIAALISVFVWKYRWFTTQIVGLFMLYAGYGAWLYNQGPKYLPQDKGEYLLVTCFLVTLWALFKAPDYSKPSDNHKERVLLPLIGLFNLMALALVRKVSHLVFHTTGSPASALILGILYLIFGETLRLRGRKNIYRLDCTVAVTLLLIGLWSAVPVYAHCMIAWIGIGALVFAYSFYRNDRYFRDLANIIVALAASLALGGEMPKRLVQFGYRLFSGEYFLNLPSSLPQKEVISLFDSGMIGACGAAALFIGGFITWLRKREEHWDYPEVKRDRIWHIVATLITLIAFYKIWPSITCAYVWLVFGATLFHYGIYRKEIYLRLISHLVVLWSICSGKLLGLTTGQIGAIAGIGAVLLYLDGFISYKLNKDKEVKPAEFWIDRIVTVAATIAMMSGVCFLLGGFYANLFWLGLGAALFYYAFGRNDDFIRILSHGVLLVAAFRAFIIIAEYEDFIPIFGYWRASSGVIHLVCIVALYYLHTYLLNVFFKEGREPKVLWQEEFALMSLANAALFYLMWFTLPPIAVAIAYAMAGVIFLECGQKWQRTYLQTHSALALLLSCFWLFTLNMAAPGKVLGIARRLFTSVPVIMLWSYAIISWNQIVVNKKPVFFKQEKLLPSLLSYMNFTAIIVLISYHAHMDGLGWAMYGLILLGISVPLHHSRYSLQGLIALVLAANVSLSVASRVIGSPWQYLWEHPGLPLVAISLFAAHGIAKIMVFEKNPDPLLGMGKSCIVHRKARTIFALMFCAVSALFTIFLASQTYYSVTWGGLALLTGWYGLSFREHIFRWLSLGLFGLAISKILFYDIWKSHYSIEVKIIILIGVGAALLAVSFLYNRFKDQLLQFLKEEQEKE